jgi:hypothetical protein
MDADVTVIAVADDPLLRGRTVDAMEAQVCSPPLLLQTCWADLGEAMAEVSSAWVAILPDGAQPSPDWASVLDTHLSDPDAGCVGGRVLEFDGVAMVAGWFCDRPTLAWIDWLGRIHSRFCDIPDTPQIRSAEFLRLEGVVVPTQSIAIPVLDGFQRWTRFEMDACFKAHELGRAVIFDSSLVVCAPWREAHRLPAPSDAEAWERFGSGEIAVLRRHPRRLLGVWLTGYSLLIGSRVSPGILLWPFHAMASSRRSRWSAVIRGKLRGMGGG